MKLCCFFIFFNFREIPFSFWILMKLNGFSFLNSLGVGCACKCVHTCSHTGVYTHITESSHQSQRVRTIGIPSDCTVKYFMKGSV